jgi:hypothetical protein
MLEKGTVLGEIWRIDEHAGSLGQCELYDCTNQRVGWSATLIEIPVASEDEGRETLMTWYHLEKKRHPWVPSFIDGREGSDRILVIVARHEGGKTLAEEIGARRQAKKWPAPYMSDVGRWGHWLLEHVESFAALGLQTARPDIAPWTLKMDGTNQLWRLDDYGVLIPAALRRAPGGGPLRTHPYAAPEIVAGGDGTVKSEYYSIGATLYFTLSTEDPVPASERLAAVARGARDPQPTLRERGTLYHDVLSDAISRSMALDPESRLVAGDELREALRYVPSLIMEGPGFLDGLGRP